MAISDRNINFRAPERTHSRIRDLMNLFERDRSWTLREGADVFWEFMFDPAKLAERCERWQAFMGKIAQHAATQPHLERAREITRQMWIYFPPHADEVTFFPRFGGRREREVA